MLLYFNFRNLKPTIICKNCFNHTPAGRNNSYILTFIQVEPNPEEERYALFFKHDLPILKHGVEPPEKEIIPSLHIKSTFPDPPLLVCFFEQRYSIVVPCSAGN